VRGVYNIDLVYIGVYGTSTGAKAALSNISKLIRAKGQNISVKEPQGVLFQFIQFFLINAL
jgi:hypothetical protein